MHLPAFPLAIFNLGGTELVLILLIVLILFGGTRLPSLARGLGQAIREFKKASSEDADTKPETDSTKTTEGQKPGSGPQAHGPN